MPGSSSTCMAVGIDFGTAYSGFAYQDHSSGQLQNCQKYHDNQGLPAPKTKTCLLYAKGNPSYGRPIAWGGAAEYKFMATALDQRGNYTFVESFKLGLAPPSEASRAAALFTLPAGLTVEQLISDFLRCLWDFAVEFIKRTHSTFNPAQARVGMTVPAQWSDQAKAVMRKAAYTAGITASEHSDSLVLVHEPEAAAVRIRSLEKLALSKGETMMVVDAGGGTVDITLHKVEQRGSSLGLSEVQHRQGLMAGAKFLDQEFEKELRQRFGAFLYDGWKHSAQNAGLYIKFMNADWEGVKQDFSGDTAKKAEIRLPRTLSRLLTQAQRERLVAESEVQSDSDLTLDGSQLKRMFDSVVGPTLAAIRKVVQESGVTPTHVIVVGGLGSNPYLFKEIKSAFQQRSVVTSTAYPYSAVVEGAVLYAHNPLAILSRRSLLTYGVRTACAVCADSPDDTFIRADGTVRCRVGFKKYVQRNEVVAADQEVIKIHCPVARQQEQVRFDIYATEALDAKYTTERGMVKVGAVTLHIKDPSKVLDPDEYDLKVIFKFGSTEITVKATDAQTQESVQTTITYHSAL